MNLETIDRIHARLLVRYGTEWLRLWQGIPEELVKADWANELAHCSQRAIEYALENLPPDRPPKAAQFKALCSNRPDPKPRMLPPPGKANPKLVSEAMQRMNAAFVKRRPLEWAYSLQEREKNGGTLTEAQRHVWRETLRHAPNAEEVLREFRGVPVDALPPAMRPDAHCNEGPAV